MNLDNCTEIRFNLTSKNGYRIYDLMKPVYPDDGHGSRLSGYVGASGKVFYTENETLAKAFHDAPSVESQKELIRANPSCLRNDTSIAQMDEGASKAFWHLSSQANIKETMRNKNYGCAYLMQDDCVLVFFQGKLGDIYNERVNLNNSEEFKSASLKLLDAYESGRIKPEAIITDGAFDKLKESLSNSVNVPKLSSPHVLKDEIETFISFTNHFQVNVNINYSNSESANLSLDNGANRKNYEITKSNKLNFVKVDGEEKSMSGFLKDLYYDSKVLDTKIASFLSKKP